MPTRLLHRTLYRLRLRTKYSAIRMILWTTTIFLTSHCIGQLAMGAGSPETLRTPTLVTSGETWNTIYQGKVKLGYSHTRIESKGNAPKDALTIVRDQHLKLTRFGETLEVRVQLTSRETQDGTLRSFRLRAEAGPSPVVVDGVVRGKHLAITITSQGKTTQYQIDWSQPAGGFFADELALRRRPMQPGERRKLRALWPGLSGVQIATADLEALKYEETPLLKGARRLLKIRVSMHIGSQELDGFYWIDQAGRLWKSQVGGMNQITYRTTRAVAMSEANGQHGDLGVDSIVHVTPPLPSPYQTRRVVYQAHLKTGNPTEVFVDEVGQQVKKIDDHTATIVVTAIRPDKPARVGPASDPPKASDLASNSLVQSDDPKIARQAKQIASQQKDPWAIALAMEKWVHDSIHQKNYSQGFATAADVIRSMEGDCTEHAVLLAALCRARKIPARVAIGLVYSVAHQGFAYHMWNQVWIKDRWIPIDGTFGMGGTGAARLTLGTSDLSDARAENIMLRVMHVLGQLQLKILTVDGAVLGNKDEKAKE